MHKSLQVSVFIAIVVYSSLGLEVYKDYLEKYPDCGVLSVCLKITFEPLNISGSSF